MPRKKKKISLKTKRRFVLYFKWGLGITAFVGFFIAFLILVRLPEVTIAVVNINGTHYSKENLVKEVVNGQLKGSYMFLVPKENAIFYPKANIKKEVLAVFVPVKEIKLSQNGLNILNVDVVERVPVAKWCSSFSSTSPCYLLDEDGLVFAPEEGAGFISYSGNIEGAPVGNKFLNGDFNKLYELISQMNKTTGRSPERVLVDGNDDVTISFKEGGELKFTRVSDENILLDNIASVFASRRLKTDETLLYADFRFGNKVYVKFSE